MKWRAITHGFFFLLVMMLLTGFLYPGLITAISRLAFPWRANGSLLSASGKMIGSTLIGQYFDDPKYFWGRPSATSHDPYDASLSSASNLTPAGADLQKEIEERIKALRDADPAAGLPVPADLVTASGSGLDPEISPAAAYYQVDRIAKARGRDPAAVRRLVAEHTKGRQLGVLGEPRVNVLELNLALDGVEYQHER